MGNKFESILIASDIDGTFLKKDGTVPERNLERLDYFKANGGSFTFSTGRSFFQIFDALPEAGDLCNVPAVTCNGSSLYDLKDKRELWRCLIDSSVVKELYDYVDGLSVPVGIRMGTDRAFYYSALNNPYIWQDATFWGQGEQSVLPVAEWKNYPIYKLALRAEAEILDRIRPELTARFAHQLTITQSASTLIDIQAAGRTKAALLSEFTKEYFARPMTLCVIGDYDNDLEMLSISDLPCCPSNALGSVKAICKRAFCSCDEGAIGDLIDYLDTAY